MITDANNFDASKICFLESRETTLMSKDVKIKIIPIRIKDSDGSLKPLLLATDKCFSRGIQNYRRYELPIVLFNKNQSGAGDLNPTDHQRAFLKAFEEIIEVCKTHCLEKLVISKNHEIEKIGKCLRVNNEIENYSPTIFSKIPYCTKKKKFLTKFYEMNDVEDTTEGGKEADPIKIIGESLNVKALLNFEYISVLEDSIRLQVRTEEVNFQIFRRRRIMSSAVAAPLK